MASEVIGTLQSDYAATCLSHHLLGFSSFLYLLYFAVYYGLVQKRFTDSKSYQTVLFCVCLTFQIIVCSLSVLQCEFESLHHSNGILFLKVAFTLAFIDTLFSLGVYIILTVRKQTPFPIKKLILFFVIIYISLIVLFGIGFALSAPVIMVVPFVLGSFSAAVCMFYGFYLVYSDTNSKLFLIIGILFFISSVPLTITLFFVGDGLPQAICRIMFIIFGESGIAIGVMELDSVFQAGMDSVPSTHDYMVTAVTEQTDTDTNVSAFEMEVPEQKMDNEMEELAKVTCCQRMKLLVCPIKSLMVHYTSDNDGFVRIIVVPQAFRMLYYVGFIIFMAIAVFTTLQFSDFDPNDPADDPFIERFGGTFFCIFFDFPPFSLFGATLYLPLIFVALCYEMFDQIRVYDTYIDGEISKTFYTIYAIVTVFECIVWVFSIQFQATNPIENLYLHSIPFLLLLNALWTMGVKSFLYMRKVGVFEGYKTVSKWKGIVLEVLGWIYIVLCTLCMLIMGIYVWPALFEAYLHKKDEWVWFATLTGHTIDLWIFLTIFAPLIIYFILAKDLKTLTITINRTIAKKRGSVDESRMLL